MKAIKATLFALGMTIALLSVEPARAQFMPIVYDNVYGRDNKLNIVCADFMSGDVVATGTSSGRVVLTWLDRQGDARFTRQFSSEEFTQVAKIIPLDENKIMLVGRCAASSKDGKRGSGRAMIITIAGATERSTTVGTNDKTVVTEGQLLKNGNLILSGSTGNAASGISGFISKILSNNKVAYTYVAANGEVCSWFDVLGSRTEYINAAFSAIDKNGSSVVRLDESGKPFFITLLPDAGFKIENMTSNDHGEVYLVGQGPEIGGAVLKLRPEGDIVFQKQIIPSGAESKLNQLIICPTGELLIGGYDSQNAYFSLLRSDGTELSSNVDRGIVSGLANNPDNGDCVIGLYDAASGKGRLVKISKDGRRLFDKMTAANYSSLRFQTGGDVLMASPQSGRLSMLSNLGELLFDRFIVEGTPIPFIETHLPANGEAVFLGTDNRVAKLAHGVYVSDIQVNEPISGTSTAIFTVTLSGYSFSPEGAPVPVTVNYKTSAQSAVSAVNYEAVAGTVSFIPSNDGNERYLNKFVVEVPIMANDKLEGNRTFSLDLSDVKQSYLIKSSSIATIADQPAVVKMIRTTPGTEGAEDMIFELGIFKTNGTPLINATKADIVVDGTYGNGTADRMDFEMGRIPRLVIPSGRHSGEFNVVSLDDTRYESVKSVVVDFSKVYSMSDTDVSLGSSVLSCSGELFDQPAMVAIESLGDHTNLNNVLSGFFKISLLRAKDGALLTNNSGSDVVVTTAVNESSSAKQGTNFVLSNAHDLRIWGDGKSSAVNLSGIVLFTQELGAKTVGVSLRDVKADPKAGKISIAPNRNSAQFTIKNQ